MAGPGQVMSGVVCTVCVQLPCENFLACPSAVGVPLGHFSSSWSALWEYRLESEQTRLPCMNCGYFPTVSRARKDWRTQEGEDGLPSPRETGPGQEEELVCSEASFL